jgi:beta-lactamase regulating signal transducer with metallopeptidase domain
MWVSRFLGLSLEWMLWGTLVWLVLALVRPRRASWSHALVVLVLLKPLVGLWLEFPLTAVWQDTWSMVPGAAWAETMRQAPTLGGYLLFIWCVGAIILAARLVMAALYLTQLRRTAEPLVQGPVWETGRRVSAVLGIAPLRLALSDKVYGPMLIGLWRPTVLLPRWILVNFTQEELLLILAHEGAHARRWDNGVLLLQRLTEIALFFHPLTWWCARHLRREAEKACDDLVLDTFPQGVRYANSLTRAAETAWGQDLPVLANGFGQGETLLVERLRRILGARPATLSNHARFAGGVFLLLLTCGGLPRYLAIEPVRDRVGDRFSIPIVAQAVRVSAADGPLVEPRSECQTGTLDHVLVAARQFTPLAFADSLANAYMVGTGTEAREKMPL